MMGWDGMRWVGWMDELMDIWMDGCKDGWTDGIGWDGLEIEIRIGLMDRTMHR